MHAAETASLHGPEGGVEMPEPRAPERDVSSSTRAPSGSGADVEVPSASETAVDALKALAHPVRLRMVEMLAEGGGELCVCEFEEEFDLTQPTISHHLKRLREAELVDSRKDGTWVHHRLHPGAMAGLADLLEAWARAPEAPEGCCGRAEA